MNRRGIYLFEVIAGIFLVSIVILGGITVLINARSQAEATKQRQIANQYGALIRSEISSTTNYSDVLVNMNGEDLVVDATNCALYSFPFSCDIFTLTEKVEITFMYPEVSQSGLKLMKFTIKLFYYQTRFIELEGILYD